MEGRSRRFYTVLSRINHLMVRCRDPGVLLAEACRIAVDEGKFVMSWVGILNLSTDKVDVVASAGNTGTYLETINIDMNDENRSRGPTGMAIRTGSHRFSNDIETDGVMEPWKRDVMALGVRSSGAFPIVVFGKVWGVFTLYSADRNFFDTDEVQLVDDLTSDLAFTIESFQNETSHQESELRLKQLAEGIKEVFFLSDTTKTEMLYISPAYETIWGRTCESLLEHPRNWLEAIHPEDRPRVREALYKQQLGTYDEEYRILRPDGEERWIRARAFPVTSPGENTGRIAGVCEDITEKKVQDAATKSLEAQLYQSQKLESLGELAGGIAHDFNNILGIILGHVSILESLPADRPIPRKNLDSIRAAGQRGANLVSQLTSFARNSEIAKEPVQLNLMVNEVREILTGTFPRNIELVTDFEKSLPLIHADPTQVHQVLLNLCVNARDAMPEGGILTLSTRKSGPEGTVELRVADTGTGMERKTMENIFKPFFTTKPKGKGSGLGLAVVYGIMEKHQGSVSVESEPGKGSTFICRFPPAAF